MVGWPQPSNNHWPVMELRQLRYFEEIVRHGSFRRAADVLNLTQPALSKSMRALEEELGVQLLERGTHGISATVFGEILVDCAASVVRDIDRAVKEIETLNGRGGGLVRVGGMTTLMRVILPPTITRLRTADPNAEVRATIGLIDDLVAQLVRGDIDLAICSMEVGTSSEAIAGEKLIADRVQVVADHLHPLVGRNNVSLSDLANQQWVLPGQLDSWRRRLTKIFAAGGEDGPHIAVEVGSSSLMAQIVAGTDFLSLLPSMVLHTDPAYEQLRTVDAALDWPPFDIFVLRRSAGALLPSTVNFLQALRSATATMAAENR